MQSGCREVGLQAKSLGELGRRLVQVRALRQNSSQLVVQVGLLRFEFHSHFQLGACGIQVAAKAGDSSQRPVSFRVARSEANACARLRLGVRQISTLSQGIGKIDVSCRETWLETEGDLKLGYRFLSMSL